MCHISTNQGVHTVDPLQALEAAVTRRDTGSAARVVHMSPILYPLPTLSSWLMIGRGRTVLSADHKQ